MKPGSFLLLTLLLFFLYSDIAAQNLARYCRGYPRNLCPRDIRYHCGSNGRTYTNKCHFCNAYVRSGRRIRLRRLGRC